MKRTKWLMSVLAVMLMLTACNKDDDTPDKPQEAKGVPTLVTIVFEPGQLGAMCTNDNLQLDVLTFANEHKESVAGSFICLRTFERTREAIKEWAEAGKDAPGSEHRLLILASPELLRCMKGVTLRETDHVLMLRTWLDDAKAVGPAGRTHVLNLSYAQAVRQAVERYKVKYLEDYADTLDYFAKKEYGPYRIYRTFCSVHVADSINETLHALFPEKKIGYFFDNTNELTGLFDIQNWGLGEIDEQEDQCNWSEMVYIMSYTTIWNPLCEEVFCQPIQFVDYGVFNRTYEWYWITHGYNGEQPQCVIIGEPGNVDKQLDYIVPNYNLSSWLSRWLANPDNMPEEEWGVASLTIWENVIGSE